MKQADEAQRTRALPQPVTSQGEIPSHIISGTPSSCSWVTTLDSYALEVVLFFCRSLNRIQRPPDHSPFTALSTRNTLHVLAYGKHIDEQCAWGPPAAAAAGARDSDKVACHAIRAAGHLLPLVTPRLLPPVSDRGCSVVLSALQVRAPFSFPFPSAAHTCTVHTLACTLPRLNQRERKLSHEMVVLESTQAAPQVAASTD